MSLLNKIRSVFGINTEISKSPIEILDTAISEHSSLEAQLEKAQEDFDQVNTDLVLKIEACSKLIEKGNSEAAENKTVLEQKLEAVTNNYLKNVEELSEKVSQAYDKRVKLEADVITKAVELTASLGPDDQKQIGDIIASWQETGLIKGEEVGSQVLAINKAIEIVVNGGEIEKAEEVEIELNEQDENFIKSLSDDELIKLSEGEYEIIKAEQSESVEGHYANVLVKKNDKILFLKRAVDKTIAPGQFCLPGGHIEKGETIEQAAIRELKEEANLTCKLSQIYIRGKAKCEDGKWAYYLQADGIEDGELALLDGENTNAVWMSKEEWLKANLFFDLKDHLRDLEMADPDEVREICKGGEGSRGGKVIGHTKSGKPIYNGKFNGTETNYKDFSAEDHKDAHELHKKLAKNHELQSDHKKRKADQNPNMDRKESSKLYDDSKEHNDISEHHSDMAEHHFLMSRKDLKKAEDTEIEKAEKKKIKREKSLTVDQVKAHAENTSSGRLKKVSKADNHKHKDAAKRELERRASEKEKKQQVINDKQIKETEKRLEQLEKQRQKLLKQIEDPEAANIESLEREFLTISKEYRKLCQELEKIQQGSF